MTREEYLIKIETIDSSIREVEYMKKYLKWSYIHRNGISFKYKHGNEFIDKNGVKGFVNGHETKLSDDLVESYFLNGRQGFESRYYTVEELDNMINEK